jgi:hypothetical protein
VSSNRSCTKLEVALFRQKVETFDVMRPLKIFSGQRIEPGLAWRAGRATDDRHCFHTACMLKPSYTQCLPMCCAPTRAHWPEVPSLQARART